MKPNTDYYKQCPHCNQYIRQNLKLCSVCLADTTRPKDGGGCADCNGTAGADNIFNYTYYFMGEMEWRCTPCFKIMLKARDGPKPRKKRRKVS